jgi:hypothetical protein
MKLSISHSHDDDLNTTIEENTLTAASTAVDSSDLNNSDRHDERCNAITSDYDHLCELSRSNNTNTLVRPFLDCYDKLFSILTTSKSTLKSIHSQPVYQIDHLTFQSKLFKNFN